MKIKIKRAKEKMIRMRMMKKLLLLVTVMSVMLGMSVSVSAKAQAGADLQNVDVDKLVETSAMLSLRVWPERDGNFLPLDPYGAYANGAAKDIDMIQGCNKDEVKRTYFLTKYYCI